VQHGLEHERRADGAGELRRPVERDLLPYKHVSILVIPS
jgi:hypothetical protein